VAYVGRENFLTPCGYFAAHAWGQRDAGRPAAGPRGPRRDLTAWSEQWLQTAGVNTLRPSYTLDDDGGFAEFAVEQEAPATHPVLRSHRIAIGLYDLTADGLVRRHRVETDVAGPRTVVTELAGQPRPDLVLVNDDDLSYAKIRLDAHSLRTLVESIAEFTHSLPAALCWSAAWDMCRDAEMATRDYVQLVMLGVSSVADISVVQTLLRRPQAVRRFADPGWRDRLDPMADGRAAAARGGLG
jgi:aminopeptidase N